MPGPKTGPLKSGPPRLRAWARSILNDIRTGWPIQGQGTSMNEFKGKGTVINARSSSGGGAGGEDNLVEVTGADNGVPATLMVQTDGNGWTAL